MKKSTCSWFQIHGWKKLHPVLLGNVLLCTSELVACQETKAIVHVPMLVPAILAITSDDQLMNRSAGNISNFVIGWHHPLQHWSGIAECCNVLPAFSWAAQQFPHSLHSWDFGESVRSVGQIRRPGCWRCSAHRGASESDIHLHRWTTTGKHVISVRWNSMRFSTNLIANFVRDAIICSKNCNCVSFYWENCLMFGSIISHLASGDTRSDRAPTEPNAQTIGSNGHPTVATGHGEGSRKSRPPTSGQISSPDRIARFISHSLSVQELLKSLFALYAAHIESMKDHEVADNLSTITDYLFCALSFRGDHASGEVSWKFELFSLTCTSFCISAVARCAPRSGKSIASGIFQIGTEIVGEWISTGNVPVGRMGRAGTEIECQQWLSTQTHYFLSIVQQVQSLTEPLHEICTIAFQIGRRLRHILHSIGWTVLRYDPRCYAEVQCCQNWYVFNFLLISVASGRHESFYSAKGSRLFGSRGADLHGCLVGLCLRLVAHSTVHQRFLTHDRFHAIVQPIADEVGTVVHSIFVFGDAYSSFHLWT